MSQMSVALPTGLVALTLLSPVTGSAGPMACDLCVVVETRHQEGCRCELWAWNPRTDALRQLAPAYEVYSFCFSPSGEGAFLSGELANRAGPFDLYLLELPSARVNRETVGLWAMGDLAWRPGTEQVAVGRLGEHRRAGRAVMPGDGGLWLLDTASAARRQLVPPAMFEWPLNLLPEFSSDGLFLACRRPWYGVAVLRVDHPEEWYCLDAPQDLLDVFVQDVEWCRDSDTLLLAVTAETRLAQLGAGEFDEVQGPGGVWEWRVTQNPVLVGARYRAMEWLVHRPEHAVSTARLLFAGGETVHAVAASHDGTRLAYVTNRGLWVADLATGRTERLRTRLQLGGLNGLDTLDRQCQGDYETPLAWSPDDSLIAGHGDDLWVVDVATAKPVCPPEQLQGQPGQLAWWPATAR